MHISPIFSQVKFMIFSSFIFMFVQFFSTLSIGQFAIISIIVFLKTILTFKKID